MGLLDDLVSKVTDPYDRQARLYPALLALLPVLALLALLYGPTASVLTGVVTMAVSCGGLYFMTNVCREFGKRLETRLFLEWGGTPSTQLLRHRDGTIEGVTKRRYHSFLAGKIGEVFPDKDQEAGNPGAADELYQSGVRWLLSHTRPDDTKKFDLLFKENITYGFRRNAVGIKRIGVLVSAGCVVWVLARQIVIVLSSGKAFTAAAFWRLPDAAVASLLVSGVMLAAWILFFTKATVRTAAFTYAEMLLRGCDLL